MRSITQWGGRIPPGIGNVIHQLSITRIPLARPPFPLPGGVPVNFYFTIQPGGAYVEVNGAPAGAKLYYPNQNRAPAGFSMSFWNYDPSGKGWYIYGNGKVDANRRYVVPDPGTQRSAYYRARFR